MAVLDEFNKINDGLWFYLKFMKMPIRWSNWWIVKPFAKIKLMHWVLREIDFN
jgi:hypothetical protein